MNDISVTTLHPIQEIRRITPAHDGKPLQKIQIERERQIATSTTSLADLGLTGVMRSENRTVSPLMLEGLPCKEGHHHDHWTGGSPPD
jgi:hypothetical protein